MTSNMKILIVTPLALPDIGGPATHAALVEKEFPAQGVAVTMLPFSSVKDLPKLRGRIVFTWRIFRAARKADLLYVLDPVSVGFPALLASFFAGRPYVLRIAGDYAWEQGVQRFGINDTLDDFVNIPLARRPLAVFLLGVVERFVAHRAARIIVPSEYLRRIVTLWGVNPSLMTVVYNAFHAEDVPKETRDILRKHHVLYGTIIMTAGRLVPWKGFRTLVNIMPEIVAVIPEATLFIAGSGPDEAELRREIAARGLEKRIRLLGELSHKELLGRIAAADMFILNTGYEGFSHQLLEVMACGTPIITTNVGGNPELIEDGKTGFLVSHDNTQALRSAILALYENPDRAWALAAEAQALVARFTEKRMVEETISVLREAAKR